MFTTAAPVQHAPGRLLVDAEEIEATRAAFVEAINELAPLLRQAQHNLISWPAASDEVSRAAAGEQTRRGVQSEDSALAVLTVYLAELFHAVEQLDAAAAEYRAAEQSATTGFRV
ncbi:hypothetical protein N8J89_05505 [Crossiella sp. CA-258035]|uniref:hypothetical protein n=1 Tax=Crossiella sp. CA-258035 TaxID=2981138 RepID=UPI0024BC67F1|nr:hypothetical protein [Crossiella sp. CA-258035]WHT20526.1 hypothetical protein N8J89_05505 [Crossiella sp. CA-258035]